MLTGETGSKAFSFEGGLCTFITGIFLDILIAFLKFKTFKTSFGGFFDERYDD